MPAPRAPDVPASASTTASPVATDDLLMESYLPWRGDRPGFAAYAEPHDPHGGMRLSSGKARRTLRPWPARRAAPGRRDGAAVADGQGLSHPSRAARGADRPAGPPVSRQPTRTCPHARGSGGVWWRMDR